MQPSDWADELADGLSLLRSGDHERALAVFDRVRRGAAAAVLDEVAARAAIYAGVAAQNLGRLEQALGILPSAVQLARSAGRPRLIASASSELGSVLRQAGRHTDSCEFHRQALSLFSAAGDEASAARESANLGLSALAAGQVDEADVRLREALGYFQDTDDGLGAAMALTALAQIWRRRGDWDDSENALAKAISIYEARGARRELLPCLQQLGQLYRARNQLDRAEQAFVALVEVARSTNAPRELAHGTLQRGLIEWARGNLGNAEILLAQAESSFREIADDMGLATALTHLGGIEAARGDTSSAMARLDAAIRKFDGSDDTESTAAVHVVRGQLLAGLGRYRDAETEFRGCRDRLLGKDGLAVSGIVDGNLAALACVVGSLDEAEAIALGAVRHLEQWGDADSVVVARLVRARVSWLRGDTEAAWKAARTIHAGLTESCRPDTRADVLLQLARYGADVGSAVDVVRLATDALERFRAIGHATGTASALTVVAHVCGVSGFPSEAEAAAEDAIDRWQKLRSPRGECTARAALAAALGAQGSVDRARENWQAAIACVDAIGGALDGAIVRAEWATFERKWGQIEGARILMSEAKRVFAARGAVSRARGALEFLRELDDPSATREGRID